MKRYNYTLDDETVEKLRALAAKWKCSVSAAIRRLAMEARGRSGTCASGWW